MEEEVQVEVVSDVMSSIGVPPHSYTNSGVDSGTAAIGDGGRGCAGTSSTDRSTSCNASSSPAHSSNSSTISN